MMMSVLAAVLVVSDGGMTLSEALERVRSDRAAGNASIRTIVVKGRNFLRETVRMTESDHDLVIEGRDGATFLGGTKIARWRKEGGVFVAPLPSGGVRELWVNGRRAAAASTGRMGIGGFSRQDIEVGNDKTVVERTTLADAKVVSGLSELSARERDEARMLVYHKWNFARRRMRGFDAMKGVVTTYGRLPHYDWDAFNAEETLVEIQNVRFAFREPGTWFADQAAGKLFYLPLPDEDPARVVAYVPHSGLTRLIDCAGDYARGGVVSNVVFRSLRFAFTDGADECRQYQAAVDADAALSFAGTRNVRIENCRVEHTGGYAIRFSSGCTSNMVVSCTLNDLGAGGIWLGSHLDCRGNGSLPVRAIVLPDRPDSTAFNLVSNCTIVAGGRYNPEGVGIVLGHCSDTRVIGNEIRDFFYTGISVGWAWGYRGSVAQRNEIAWNRISDLGQGLMSDMGGIYMLATSFGSRVHHNTIHDINSRLYGGWALYCDEGAEGIVFEDNICWNTSNGCFHQHYGVGCIVRNNIFAFNREKGAVCVTKTQESGIPSSLHFVNNIVYVDGTRLVGYTTSLQDGVWANNVWYDTHGADAAWMDGMNWREWQKSGRESNGVFADPLFVDAAHFDFRLRPDSPAFRVGFRPINPIGRSK